MGDHGPLSPGEACRAVAVCFASTFPLVAHHRLHLPCRSTEPHAFEVLLARETVCRTRP